MTGVTYDISGNSGRMWAYDGETPVFDTDAFPVQLFGADKQITLTGQTLAFPDGVKGNAYQYARGTYSGVNSTGCASYITIGNQEWTEDTDLGEVPPETDFLLVEVNLTRTQTPSQILGRTIPVTIKEGSWVTAPGGGILLERLAPLARSLQFFKNASNHIIMRKKQSVTNTTYTYWRQDNNPALQGWTYGGAAGRKGHIVYGPLQAIGPVFDPSLSNFARGTGSQCSLSDPTNYASTYVGDIKVTPGVHSLTEEETGGGGIGGRFFSFNGDYVTEAQASSYSWTGVDFGLELDTRLIAVVARGVFAGTPNQGMNTVSVTVGGVAASQKVAADYYFNSGGGTSQRGTCSIWVVALPTGATGQVDVVFNSLSFAGAIEVYSLYGMSATPVHVNAATANNTSTSISLANTNGGVILIGAAGRPLSTGLFSLSGVGNALTQRIGGGLMDIGRGFQFATGTTLGVSLVAPNPWNTRLMLCGASFF